MPTTYSLYFIFALGILNLPFLVGCGGNETQTPPEKVSEPITETSFEDFAHQYAQTLVQILQKKGGGDRLIAVFPFNWDGKQSALGDHMTQQQIFYISDAGSGSVNVITQLAMTEAMKQNNWKVADVFNPALFKDVTKQLQVQVALFGEISLQQQKIQLTLTAKDAVSGAIVMKKSSLIKRDDTLNQLFNQGS